MVVYIEYALAWNFLLDGVLLSLAQFAARTRIKWGKTAFSALFGAVFAVIYPLTNLGLFWGNVSKFAVGFVLCFFVSNGIKTKKQRGRYGLICLFFYSFCFVFGGTMSAVNLLETTPKRVILIVAAALTVICVFLTVKSREKRVIERSVYDCAIAYKQREKRVFGFFDSGNLASKNGYPVCFLSADVFYDLFVEKNVEDIGQVWDEMTISTLTGERKISLVLGEIRIEIKGKESVKKRVYFSPTANMLEREYDLLLSARIFEEDEEGKEDEI